MSKLNQFKYDWNNAAIATNEYITPEDGQYRVMIENVKYTENDKDGFETDPTFIYTFVVTDGKYKGQKFRRYTAIRNEKSASYFKGDLQKLGIPIPADIEELPEIVRTCLVSRIKCINLLFCLRLCMEHWFESRRAT